MKKVLCVMAIICVSCGEKAKVMSGLPASVVGIYSEASEDNVTGKKLAGGLVIEKINLFTEVY